MISLAINFLDRVFGNNDKISIENQELSEMLECTIIEISEKETYAIPSLPIDTDETIADTIYTLPKIITARVFVLSDDIVFFEKSLTNIQNSDDFFKITSLYAKTYDNLKLLEWSADTNANVLGGRHYILTLQNIIRVEAQAVNVSNFSNSSYTSNSNLGTKPNNEVNKSALLKGVEMVGGL